MPSGAILLLGVFVALVAYGAWYVSSSRDKSIAELISPLPERLVAFLRDGDGVAGPEGPVQRQSAPETPQSQRTASNNEAPAATDQAPSSPSRSQAPITTDRNNPPSEAAPSLPADTIDQGNPSAVTSPAEKQGDGSAAGAADSETAIRESLRIDGNSADEEAQVSIANPPASGGADTQPAGPPTVEPEPSTAASPDARIVLRAKGENWVEIREGDTDRLVIARLFQPGDTFDVPDTPGLKLLTGNAGGLEILVDGEPVPPLGIEGMVRRNIPLDAEQLRSGALARN